MAHILPDVPWDTPGTVVLSRRWRVRGTTITNCFFQDMEKWTVVKWHSDTFPEIIRITDLEIVGEVPEVI